MAVALFDTNILIDFLRGYKPAIDEIEYWDDAVISSITWMELMANARELHDEEYLTEFLSNFRVTHTDDNIMNWLRPFGAAAFSSAPKSPCPTPSSWQPANCTVTWLSPATKRISDC
jgi:predicted nucleic acid-binding protein